ncbi:DUF4249 family protein [candidate division KSB1 bacterium]|nr:DUF4249 family protein [candidate division KSB1 bacterium]
MKIDNYYTAAIITWISLFLFSCSLDPVVIDPDNAGEYYVLCTLSAGYSRQTVRIGRAKPEHLPVDITDAQVRIYTDRQNVPFSHLQDGRYVENGEKLQVINGETYYLDVQMQNGDKISAETTIPRDFNILHPCSGDTIEHFVSMSLDTLLLDRIRWERCPGAEHYTVILDLPDPDVRVQSINTFRTDVYLPEIVASNWMEPLSGEKTLDATCYVFARDSTCCFYYTYRRFVNRDVDGSAGHELDFLKNNERNFYLDKMNITGATGAFHGVAMDSAKFTLKLYMDWW